MRTLVRVALIGLFILAVSIGVMLLATDPRLSGSSTRPAGTDRRRQDRVRSASPAKPQAAPVPLYSEKFVDDSGFDVVTSHMPTNYDRRSLEAHRQAMRTRSQIAISRLQEQLNRLGDAGSATDPTKSATKARLTMLIGLVHMHDGRFEEAVRWIDQARREGEGLPPLFRTNMLAMLGVAALRRGEVDNCVACVGPSSCIFPIVPEAQHQFPGGSRDAFNYFLSYLKERPEDLGVRWLLGIAAMTLGEYPGSVPEEYRIAIEPRQSGSQVGRFANVTAEVGLDVRGANMAGGSAFDDFNGDGLPDVFFSSCDDDRGAALFLNRGGRFEEIEVSKSSLKDQDMSLNLQHADYDNDGRLDVLILRGGWEGAGRLSLLRNLGEGRFEDMTESAGLSEPIACQSAAWGDYDNDGKLDVYVVGEQHADPPDPTNFCRLYHNNGDGTFRNVAAEAGVLNEGWAKGASWGDYDDDGRLDLYVANMWGSNRLYRNLGNGTFSDVAGELGVRDPFHSFSCWFWDYDNDGKLDLFVCGYFASLQEIVADRLGKPTSAELPRLYHNLGGGRFEDVTVAVGLDRVMLPMGTNFADIDNDGFLDMYLGTGQPAYMSLAPNVMFKNDGGRRFLDVTEASGTGHLQKGHGVSFADADGDGDLDLFVQLGGVATGDKSHNVLFRNPGTQPARHWLGVKLVGVQTNRAAIGARIQADFKEADGTARSIFRTIGAGSSFGGNSLVAHLGLGGSMRVDTLTVSWPVSGTRQVFHDIPADETIVITEGSSEYRQQKRP